MSNEFRDIMEKQSRQVEGYQQPFTEGVKYDTDKPPVGLFPTESLIEISKVLGYGAKKYAAHNWRKGMKWSRMYDAAQRHLLAFNSGDNIDLESGLLHLAHAGCCIVFLLAYQVSGIGEDDRFIMNKGA